jgi:hypothetical protein
MSFALFVVVDPILEHSAANSFEGGKSSLLDPGDCDGDLGGRGRVQICEPDGKRGTPICGKVLAYIEYHGR